ncbi:MAG: PAS domain-containing protein [Rhodospirillales bacterium]|jgi:PAS domain S-box-containing protein
MDRNSPIKTEYNLDLRTVFDSVEDSIVVLDRDLVIIEANQKLFDNFNSTRDEVIGHTLTDFFSDEVAEFRVPMYRKVFAENESLEYESERDGVWYQTKLKPLFDDNGVVIGLA